MNPDQHPTKSALKRKYGINNDDFEILTRDTTPSAQELKDAGHMIEQVADWFGVPTYIIRRVTALAAVVAVLLIPAHVKSFQDEVRETRDFYVSVFNPFQKLPEPERSLPSSSFSFANVATTSSSVIISPMIPPSGGV